MIRRLIRWLARKEIAGAVALAELTHAVSLPTLKLTSYMQGHADGVRDAMKVVEEEVDRSKELGQEQVANAKKRMLH